MDPHKAIHKPGDRKQLPATEASTAEATAASPGVAAMERFLGLEQSEAASSTSSEALDQARQATVPGLAPGSWQAAAIAKILAPARQSDELGRLGPYRVLSVLGQGGMGMVFRAEDPGLRRQVALKVMLPQYAANETARARFLREARAQAAVEHDHIAAIFQVGEQNGTPFIAMPLFKGQTLADALKLNPHPPLPEILRIGREIAEGLDAAHEVRLIHRDIKPSNIWLEGSRRRAKILDFGLARAVSVEPGDSSAEPVTASGAVIGTPAFMAPEQASGESVDARADLFSLGVVLYQMATGALPFKTGSTFAMLTSLAVDKPKPPIERNPNLPPELNALILQLLEKNPVDRPHSAEQVARELERIGKHLTYAALPAPIIEGPDPWADIDLTETEVLPLEPASKTKPTKGRRVPALVVALGCVLLIAAAFAAYQLIFATPQGTLIVELADADVEARFRNGELRLHDKDGKLLYTLKPSERNRDLPAGRYLIEVVGADGLKVDVPEFTIEKNGKATVRVLLDKQPVVVQKPKPKKEPDKKERPPAAVDHHRATAEMILRHGGTVDVKTIKEQTTVTQLADLPQEPFILMRVSVLDFAVADDDLKALAGVEFIPTIVFRNAKITDAGLRHLRNVRTRSLNLSWNAISDASLDFLSENTGITYVAVGGAKITDAVVPELMKLPHLRSVSITDARITAAGLRQLAGHKRIQSLDLGSGVGAQGLAHLHTMPSLGNLNLVGFGDEVIEPLSAVPQLRLIRFTENRGTAEGARKLQKALPNADILHDAIAPSEDQRKAIQWALDQKATVTVSPKGRIEKVPATAFTVYEIVMPQKAKGDAANLRGIRNIITLKWTGMTNADAEAEHLATLDSLTYLDLSHSDLTATGLQRLTALKQLNSLYLGNPKSLTDEGFDQLSKFEQLRLVTLKGRPITDGLLKHLSRVSSLQTLIFGNSQKISAAGLEHLATLPVLWHLDLSNTALDDTAVLHLKQLTQLRVLELQGTKITAAGVAELQKALPRCAIFWDGGLIAPGALTQAELDRRVAEWAISKGGTAGFKEAKTGKYIVATHPKELPVDMVLTNISVNRTFVKTPAQLIDEAGLEQLANLDQLQQLGLSSQPVTDEWLKRLVSFRVAGNLSDSLGLNATQITNEGLAHLRAFSKMKRLGLQWTQIDDAGLVHLQALTGLRHLDVRNTKVTEAGAKKLAAALPNCKIDFQGGVIQPKGSSADREAAEWVLSAKGQVIVRMTNGTEVRAAQAKDLPVGEFSLVNAAFHQPTVTDADLEKFAGLANLRALTLYRTEITDVGLEHLQGLTQLEYLDLSFANVTDAGLERLQGLTALRTLWLTSTKVTGASLKHLKGMTKLGILYLAGTDINDQATGHFFGIVGRLFVLELRQTKVTAPRAREIAKSLPQCYIYTDAAIISPVDPERAAAEWVLSVGGTVQVEVAGEEILRPVPTVKDLPAGPLTLGNVGIRSKAVGPLIPLSGVKKIGHLSLIETEVTDAALAHLKDVTITTLNLTRTRVTDAGLEYLKNKNGLRYLTLNDLLITDKGLELLGDKVLSSLSLDGTRVTDAGLQHLKGMNLSEVLSLRRTAVTDVGLEQLTALTSLKQLFLQQSKVTPAGVEKLQKALPNCKIGSNSDKN